MDIRLLPAANKYLSSNERLLRYDRVKITDAILNEFEKLPEKANNFDYVAIDMNGDGTLIKEILTFFDNAGTMLSRFFLENGVSKRRNEYICKGKTSKVNKFVKSDTTISEDSDKIDLYMNLNHWISTELFKKATVKENNDSEGQVLLHKKIVPLKHPKGYNYSRSYTFAKYPLGDKNQDAKLFSAILENIFSQQERAQIFIALKSENLDINLEDNFLTARILGLRSRRGISEFVKILLEQKGLNGLGVITHVNEFEQQTGNMKRLGHFEMGDHGAYIVLRDSLVESGPIDGIVRTAGHEADHAWRYSLIGRLGAGQTRYEILAGKTLPQLSIEESEEAIRCKIAKENYVPAEVDFQKYYGNYLEVKAREEGENTVNEFKCEGENYEFFSGFEDMYH